METITIVYYVYAVFLTVGGFIGYSKAKSAPSLIAGVISAVLVAVAGHLVGHHHRLGVGLGLIVSLALGIVFFGRYQKTKKFMPSLMMCIVSVIVLVLSLIDISQRLHS